MESILTSLEFSCLSFTVIGTKNKSLSLSYHFPLDLLLDSVVAGVKKILEIWISGIAVSLLAILIASHRLDYFNEV